MTDDIDTLLTQARRGDSRAFGGLVERFHKAAMVWAVGWLDDEHEAEDAVQDAFLTALRELPNLRENAAFPAWFRRIVRTACDRRTRGMRGTVELNEVAMACASSGFAELFAAKQDLWRAVRALSPALRSCVELHYVGGYQVREISRILGVPEGTVKRRLHDARTLLRERIAPESLHVGGAMKKELTGLRYEPAWISHLGSMYACAKYLEMDVSKPWLWGGTGHAFIINITPDACPSGPTAWKSGMLLELARNLGVHVEAIQGFKSQRDFQAKQAAAWAYTRACVDMGIPCYAWELGIPEYGVIVGYDDEGYYHSSPPASAEPAGPVPWEKLGDSEIGVLEMLSVQKGDAQPVAAIVQRIARCASEHAEGSPQWTHERYTQGATAFRIWADGVEAGTAIDGGHRYNAECWSECRRMAVGFLEEARGKLPESADSACNEAIEAYRAVSDTLEQVRDRHPFKPEPGIFSRKVTDAESARLLREAADAEERALAALGRLADAL